MVTQRQPYRTFSTHRHVAAAILLASVLGTGGHVSALPQESEVREGARAVPDVSRDVYNKLNRAQRDINRKRFERAEVKLRNILQVTQLNRNETALATNMLAFVCLETGRRAESIAFYREVLAYRNSISESLELTVLWALAQLAFTSQDYDRALSYADQWLILSNNPSAEVLALVAMANYKLNQAAAAINAMTKAIEIELAAERQPNENWLKLITYLHTERRDWASFVRYQEMYVKRYPSQKGWVNLANAYTNLNQLEAAQKAQERADRLSIVSP